jgi:WD40 repeat protein
MSNLKEYLSSQNSIEQKDFFEIIRNYVNGSDTSENRQSLYEILTNLEFLDAKLSILDVAQLIEDYRLVLESKLSFSDSQRQVLDLISKAISQLSNVLEYDKNQLPGQLLGKLSNLDKSAFEPFLEQIKDWDDYPWLKPLRVNILSPKDSLIRTLAGGNYFQAMAISQDGTFAVTTGYGDGLIKQWDLKTGKLLKTLEIQETYKKLRELLIDLSSRRDYTEENVKSITEEEMIKKITFAVIAISPDGNWLATGSSFSERLYSHNASSESIYSRTASIEPEDTIFELWNLEEEKSVLCFGAGFKDRINSIALSYNAKYAVIGNVYGFSLVDIDGLLNNYQYLNDAWINIRSDMEASGYVGSELEGINAVAISDDNHWMFAGNNKFIKIWDLYKGRLHLIIPLESIDISGIHFIKFNANYQLIFSSIHSVLYQISLENQLKENLLNRIDIEKLSQSLEKIFNDHDLYLPYKYGHGHKYRYIRNESNIFQLDFYPRSAFNFYEFFIKFIYNLVRNVTYFILKRRVLPIKKLATKTPDNVILRDITPDGKLSISPSNDGGIELWNL